MTADPRVLATICFRSWQDTDFAALRSTLADDVTFRGPLGTADGADQCIEGMRGLARTITDIVIRAMVVEGPDPT